MSRRWLTFVLVGAAVLGAGCRTAPSPFPPIHFEEKCLCGTEDADLHGCVAACIVEGRRACANPRCVCDDGPGGPGR